MDFRQQFIEFAIQQGALLFGEYKTKAGRLSPYFFNSGLFTDGQALARLSQFYAQAALATGWKIDTIFGPAYKGITLAAGTAIALAQMGHNLPFCYNRKEAKDHGEGGLLVGAPLKGNVLIVDDVITDGASKRESLEIIRSAGATPVGVLIALDRQERGVAEGSTQSAAQEFEGSTGVPVKAVATVGDLMRYLKQLPDEGDKLQRIEAYRHRFGAMETMGS